MSKQIVLSTGIDRYDPAYYGDCNLSGCVKDALAFERYMQHIWPNAEFWSLLDEDVSKNELLFALRSSAEQLQSGDTLIWFHSGHGSYSDTKNFIRYTCRCLHDQELWDYELVNAWKLFKPGVRIICISDTCYSESNSRMAQIPMPEGSKVRAIQQRAPLENPPKITEKLLPNGLKFIEISACSAYQVSWENEKGGVFTNALLEAHEPGLSIGAWYSKVFKKIDKQYKQDPKMHKNIGSNAFKSEILF